MKEKRPASPLALLGIALLAAFAGAPRLAAQSNSGQVNGEGCWCGTQVGVPKAWVVRGRSGTAAMRQAAADAISQWALYASVLAPTVDAEPGVGRIGNGINEANVLIDGKDAKASYRMDLEPGLFGVAVMLPEKSFGTFDGCRYYEPKDCAPFVEADVILNAEFYKGWTADWFAPGADLDSPSPGIVHATSTHEVGHALGLHHVFDLPGKTSSFSVMNYADHDVRRWVTRMDANTLRAAYPGQVLKRTDVGVFPFTYGNGSYRQAYARLPKSSVRPGEVFPLDRWTLENIGTEEAKGVEVRFYAWPEGTRKYPEPTDVPLGTASFATVPVNDHGEFEGTPLTVPEGTPGGSYTVGAIVFVGGAEDSPWVAGKPNNNRFAVGHNPYATLTVLAPPRPDAVTADFAFAPADPAAGEPTSFFDRSLGLPASWTWRFGDAASGEANVSTARNPVHAFSSGGSFTVTLDVEGPSNRSSLSRVVRVSGGVAGGTVTRLVPVVLDVGTAPRFTSELTLANRGTTPSTLSIRYTAAPILGATGTGIVSEVLPPGRQLVVPDAIAWLRAKGLAIPSTGSQGGSLRVTFSNLSSEGAAFAGARTTTPSGSGRCGLSYPGTDVRLAFTEPVVVFGLRQGADDRSNLAVVNAGAATPVTLRVTLSPADGGKGVPLPDLTLQAGEWYQYDSVLAAGPFAEGRATVERVGGTEPFLAYGVFNDQRTNDGSYVEAIPLSRADPTTGVPVVLESGLYRSELVVASLSGKPSSVLVNYVESARDPKGDKGWYYVDLAPFEQVIVPDLVDDLRQAGGDIGPRGPLYAGYLAVSFESKDGPVAGVAGARTSAPAAGGGEYGAFYPSLPLSRAAKDAWLFGLQGGASSRSNLALSNAGLEGSEIDVRLQLFDGATGRLVSEENLPRLAPRRWYQRNGVLGALANGYARLTVVGGSDSFLAYGVVNDGGTGAPGTNDGSYVAMEPVAALTPWPAEVTVTLPGGVPLTVLKVPAGSFRMGSPEGERNRGTNETSHAVTLTREYYVGKVPVTQGQWEAVTGKPMPSICGNKGVGAAFPVYCVSWLDVRGDGGFLEKLNAWLAATGQPGAGKFRLPTEAEWERAARGGTETRFSFGDALAGDDDCDTNEEAAPFALWCGNCGWKSSPVGSKGANPFGLFDVHGNLWEWVEDRYGPYPSQPVTDPKGPAEGDERVFRGGSYETNLRFCRSAARRRDASSYLYGDLGFRLARSL